jgi:hypothetical protein
MTDSSEKPRLIDVLPELAAELRTLLEASNHRELADQVVGLIIFDRCRCGDSFCASFYTQPKPDGAYVGDHNTIDLDAKEGMILLDAVNAQIAHVEVLYRDEIREILSSRIP